MKELQQESEKHFQLEKKELENQLQDKLEVSLRKIREKESEILKLQEFLERTEKKMQESISDMQKKIISNQ